MRIEAQTAGMAEFDHALAALTAEREALSVAPRLLSAILRPIVLFVLQTIIARWLVR